MDSTLSPQAQLRALPRELQIAAGGVVLLIIGAFGPWAKVGGFSVNGLDGGKDGTFTLILALVAGGLLAYTHLKQVSARGFIIGAAVAAGLTLLISVIDFLDIMGTEFVSVGWGMWMTLIGSIALTAAVAMKLRAKN